MSTRRRDRTGDESFADAVGDVRRIPDRERVVPQASRRLPRPEVAPQAPDSVSWTHPDPEEPLLGYAQGIDRRSLQRLRSGAIHAESELDLHGLREEAAREALRDAVTRAHASGVRCVRVIHGRGLHSKGAAVLRESLPHWLAEPPLGAWVLAFAPAAPEQGGSGATSILLRRERG